MKVAYVVAPSYNWQSIHPGLDPQTLKALETFHLIPSQLESYNRAFDVQLFSTILEDRGFEVVIQHEHVFEVSRKTFKERLSETLSRCKSHDDIFVFIYCGHGENELGTRHASLIFSDNKRVTSIWLDNKLAQSKASIYKVLNCCCANAMPAVYNISNYGQNAMFDIASAGAHQAKLPATMVEIFSTDFSEVSKASANGTRLALAINSVCQKDKSVSVQDLGILLKQVWKDNGWDMDKHGVPKTTPVVHRGVLSGELFGVLQEEPKVCYKPYFGSKLD